MKKFKLFFLLPGLIFLPQPRSVAQFSQPETINLTANIIPAGPMLSMPYRLSKAGPYLVIFDKNGHTLFHIFQLKEKPEYLSSFGQPGQGPGEFTLPMVISRNLPGPVFSVFDFAKRKIFHINIDSLLLYPGYTMDEIRVAPDAPMISNAVLSGNTLILSGVFQQGRFLLYDLVAKSQTTLAFKPKLTTGDPGVVYDSQLAIDGNFLYTSARYFERIDKISLNRLEYDQPLVDKVNFNLREFGGPFNQRKSGTINYYQDICVGKKYIYALYFGVPEEEMPEHIPTVQVFDKVSGAHHFNLRLDRPVSRILVDRKRLFALTPDSEDNPLVYYDLAVMQ